MTKATNETLYRIVDEYPYLEREDEYSGLTLTEAAIRMDDLTSVGADVILSDWEESCPVCGGSGHEAEPGPTGEPVSKGPCPTCEGSGDNLLGVWSWVDEETGREVTMMREVG